MTDPAKCRDCGEPVPASKPQSVFRCDACGRPICPLCVGRFLEANQTSHAFCRPCWSEVQRVERERRLRAG